MKREFHFRIVEKIRIWLLISLAVMVVGGSFVIARGLNFGLDFTGGTMMQIDLGEVVETQTVRELLEPFNLSEEILSAGSEKQEVIIRTKVSLSNDERRAIFDALSTEYSLDEDSLIAAEQFGPSFGQETRNKAVLAILLAGLGMLIYITLRFEFVFGTTSIIAVLHDVLILVSIYAIFRIPVNSSFIAAVLTIVGYSMNDTIVVFDRVRENVRLMKKSTHAKIANESINQTLGRTINTSLTTLLVIGSLYVLGVTAIKDFALPLMLGIMVGTYSSIFIASPIWAYWKDKTIGKNE
jgi:preprotein translocase SecF subunit